MATARSLAHRFDDRLLLAQSITPTKAELLQVRTCFVACMLSYRWIYIYILYRYIPLLVQFLPFLDTCGTTIFHFPAIFSKLLIHILSWLRSFGACLRWGAAGRLLAKPVRLGFAGISGHADKESIVMNASSNIVTCCNECKHQSLVILISSHLVLPWIHSGNPSLSRCCCPAIFVELAPAAVLQVYRAKCYDSGIHCCWRNTRPWRNGS